MHQGLISRSVFFEQLDEIVSGTYEAMMPLLADSAHELLGDSLNKKSGCFFHLLGFDVMLDNEGSAHLLEVNNHPSLQITSVTFDSGGCTCMDSHLPHGHDVCPVDEFVKVDVLSQALLLAVGSADCDNNDRFHRVCCDGNSPLARAHQLYREVRGSKMSGQRFRNLLLKAKIVQGSLASHEADVLYLKFQKSIHEDGTLESLAFCEQLQTLANHRYGEDDTNGLTKLLDLATSAGYNC